LPICCEDIENVTAHVWENVGTSFQTCAESFGNQTVLWIHLGRSGGDGFSRLIEQRHLTPSNNWNVKSWGLSFPPAKFFDLAV
jgi:hypothetical protein